MSDTTLVFSISAYDYLGDEVCAQLSGERGQVERTAFPDGERYLRIASECGGRDIVLVGGTIDDACTLELYDLACGLVKVGARRLNMVIPFFGYSTMERATRSGEIVTAKNRARLLSSVPIASNGNRAVLLDLHAAGIAHYFEGGTRTVHVYGKPIVAAAARRLAGNDFVLACTDAGRAKWVESLAHDLRVDAAFVYKRRISGDRTEVTGVSAHVTGRAVVIYDDMIRTGGSLLDAAKAYRDAGASAVSAIATHGLFPGDALARIESSGLLDAMVTTDSHPRALNRASKILQIEKTAPLLAAALGDAQ